MGIKHAIKHHGYWIFHQGFASLELVAFTREVSDKSIPSAREGNE
jgi:hypothetical protein